MTIVCVAANPAVDRFFEVESVAAGEIHRPIRSAALPGGKGLNVARAAHSLGSEVIACGIVGGHAGRWIEEELQAEIHDARFVHSGIETRTCLSVGDRATGTLTEFYEDPSRIDIDVWHAFRDLVIESMDGASHIAISGSIPPGAPPDGYGEIVQTAHDLGLVVALDARDEFLEKALPARPDVVKVNEREAARVVTGGNGGRAAQALANRAGATVAIITRGEKGAIAASKDGSILEGVVEERGPYPVGSGDAFLAGFLTALAEDGTVADAMRLGLGAGTANALEPGAGVLDAQLARGYATSARLSRTI